MRQDWQRTLWIMFTAQACTAIGFSLVYPFLPLYINDLGTHTGIGLEFLAGLAFSAQATTMMFASPIWGAVADRYGRKSMVLRATLGGAVIMGLMGFARSAEELVLLRAIQGAITGVVAAANAMVASVAPRNKVGYAMGLLQVALWGGVALGPLIGGVLADAYGYRVPHFLTAGMLFMAGMLVYFGVQETFTPEQKAKSHSHGFIGEWKHIIGMPGVPQAYSIRFLVGLSRSMVVPLMPLYVTMLLLDSTFDLVPAPFAHLSLTLVGVSTITGLIVGSESMTSTFSSVFFGRLGDRIGYRAIIIGCATVAVCTVVPQGFVTQIWQLLALILLTGMVVGGLVSVPSALLAQYTEPGEEGAVYGLENSVLAGARAIAPLLGAFIAAAFGIRAAFLVMGATLSLVVVVAIFFLPRTNRASLRAEENPASAELLATAPGVGVK